MFLPVVTNSGLFYLLVRLTLGDRVPVIGKAKFAGTLAYIFNPIDFLPEAFFGPLGYLDDLGFGLFRSEFLSQSEGR